MRPVQTTTVHEPYLDINELAGIMGVSASTIKRMISEGMPSENWGLKRTRRFRATDAIEWARARTAA